MDIICYNMLPSTVNIILATYNGERFLAEQLISLIDQTYSNWKLLVSDDGSTDSTLSILNYFASTDPRIIIVNSHRQGGVVKNFGMALSFVDSEYIMFCDQDDVWNHNKIELMVKNIIDYEAISGKNFPLLGFSDATIVDHDLSMIADSLYASNAINPLNNIDYRFLIWCSTVFGCTVIFNRRLLLRAFPIPSEAPMHDQWFALVAALTGSVFFVPEQTIKYRMHSNNVVGAKPKALISKLFSLKKIVVNAYYDARYASKLLSISKALLTHCDNPISFSAKDAINNCINDTLTARFYFLEKFVKPFASDRTAYVILFSFLYIISF